jgi:hypothetical protein
MRAAHSLIPTPLPVPHCPPALAVLQHDVQPLLGVLRDFRGRGTLQQFDEALRMAFTKSRVTKRGAINAYGIVQSWIEEAPVRPEK